MVERLRLTASRVALATALMMWTQNEVHAQQTIPTAQAAPSAPADQATVQEIVVTAQKRNENLQNVPISVSVATAQTLKQAGVGGTLDIAQITPGLTETHTGNAPLIFLRGVGTALGGTPGDEGGVNLVVDGVVYTSLAGEVLSLNNIDRIEVLRGPQGTLFGRNATGGVVSIVTRDPKSTPSMDLSAGYGNYDTASASAYFTSGLTNTIRADLAVQYLNQPDGFGVNVYNNKQVDVANDFSARTKLIWDVDSDTHVRLSVDYEKSMDEAAEATRTLDGEVGVLGTHPPAGFYNINDNLQPLARLQTGGASIKLDHTFSLAQFTSITAYRKSDSIFNYDQDAGPFPVVDATFVNRERQLTEEAQLSSLPESHIKWIVGAFYLDSNAREAPLDLSGLAFGPVVFDKRTGDISTKSIAGFGQATVPITATTNITGGLRYTDDKRDFLFSDISGLGIALLPPANTSKTFDQLTWRVAVDQKLSKDILAYASISTGFKAGTFNIINPLNPPIKPEKLTSYEIGLKSEFFEHRLRFNVEGFYYDYQNIQASQVLQGQTFFLNAPGTVYGADVDFELRPIRNLTLSGGFEALHAEYGNFPDAPALLPLPAVCGPNGPVALPGPATGGNVVCSINAKGNQLVRAPDFTSSLTAAYTLPTQYGAFGVAVTYAHSSAYPFEVDNRLKQPVTDLVNGQVSWMTPEKRYELRVYVRNLTDQKYFVLDGSSLGDTTAAAAPRTYGVSVAAHF